MPVRYESEAAFHEQSERAERGDWHDMGGGLRGKDVGPTYAITWYEGTGEVGARRSPQGDFFLLGTLSAERKEAERALEGIADWGGGSSPFGTAKNGMLWLMKRIAQHGHVMPDDPTKDPVVF